MVRKLEGDLERDTAGICVCNEVGIFAAILFRNSLKDPVGGTVGEFLSDIVGK